MGGETERSASVPRSCERQTQKRPELKQATRFRVASEAVRRNDERELFYVDNSSLKVVSLSHNNMEDLIHGSC